ncbi:MAG: MoaD family protein, partial [Proteobacteria bacterium]|nr:MoaD family protein [Pseudomonadota bacterium]
MRVTVKLFGGVREEAGEKELDYELDPGASVGDLRNRLAERFPIFDRLGERLAVAVNLELAKLDRELRDGDEVAFLPPVSGGAGTCTISGRTLNPEEVAARVTGPDAGGVVQFVGAVRNRARGREIQYLEYEAYPEMA